MTNSNSNFRSGQSLPTLQQRIEARLVNILNYLQRKQLDADIEILNQELNSLLGTKDQAPDN